MVTRYTSQKRRAFLLSRGVFVVLVLLLIVAGRGVWGVYTKARDTRHRLTDVRAEHEKLDERGAFLEGEIARFSTESGIEGEIRRQYGLAREGERVFVIVESQEEATTTEKGFWSTLFFWRD